MHGINIENKGFKTLTDFVRVRYVPSASSKAYVGQKVKGVYWNGIKGAHPAGNIGLTPEDSKNMGWVQCKSTGCSWVDTDGTTELVARTTAGAMTPGRTWTIASIESTADDSTWAHTIYF